MTLRMYLSSMWPYKVLLISGRKETIKIYKTRSSSDCFHDLLTMVQYAYGNHIRVGDMF